MTKLEQIEKLREKAQVSYDEAKQAYEAADGDLLEALIILEKQGKVAPPTGGGYYSSEKVNSDREDDSDEQASSGWDNFVETLEKIGKFCVDLIDKGNKSSVEILQNDQSKVKLPVTVLALLVIFLPYVILPAAVISLFFGFRYRYHGYDSNGER